MSQQEVAEAGKGFLKQAGEILASIGHDLAGSIFTTASQITTLEGELRAAIRNWAHTESSSGEFVIFCPDCCCIN